MALVVESILASFKPPKSKHLSFFHSHPPHPTQPFPSVQDEQILKLAFFLPSDLILAAFRLVDLGQRSYSLNPTNQRFNL